ncbi:MAG TPA: ankyrin repeat domain-containing protein, partial [Candidatus Methylacidiphilales bacterium]|nr:ankyrin repeat domain-containing protein [Candidatus Methylacidiphilales bacterium]
PPAKGKTAIRRVVHHRCQDLDKSRQVLRLLLKHGAAHDHVVAAWLGDIEGTLAKAGRSPRRREEALIAAAQMGELPIVKRLLDLGVNPNTPRDVEAPSRPNGIFHEEAHAVWEASAQGHLEVVRELLRRGARPNAPLCASGWPISMARHYGHRGVEALLVSAGAPPPLNWDSDTLAEIQASLPLQMEKLHEDWAMPVASRTGRLDVIDYLLSLNPRIDDEMWAWCLRYTIAGESPNSPRILRKLIAHKANPNGRNSRGETPLHFVCMRQGRANPARLDNARVLMELGADPNIVDDVRQSTPLGYAAWAGDSALAEVLLKGGADPNLCGKPWAHPLRWAHKKGHAALAEMLKQHGAQEQDDHALPAA